MIEQINFQGKEYPFLFGWSAYKEYIKTAEKIKDDVFDFYDKGIHLGFVCGAKKEGKKPFSFDKMIDMFDDSTEFQGESMDIFFKHLGVQKKIQDKAIKGAQQLSK